MSKKQKKQKRKQVQQQAPDTQRVESAAERMAKRFDLLKDIDAQLSVQPSRSMPFQTVEQVRRAFAPPVSFGAPEKERLAMDSALDNCGFYSTVFKSLQQHGYEMGQYPTTAFLGYGALQQIAQNGMIRACVQTVADDITREWIEITGGKDSTVVEDLQDLQEKKYKLRQIFHEAATITGYMGGAFIFIDTGLENDEDLKLPLKINDRSAELQQGRPLRFVVVDPVNVSPGNFNATEPLKEDYMKPKLYWVLGKLVHRSRLLSLYDNPPPTLLKPAYNFLGIPQAQILWDYVMHWNQCRVYTADLVRKVSLLVFQTATDDIFRDANGVKMFDIRMKALQRYRDNDAVFVCDKEAESVMNVQTSIAGCTDVVRQSLEMIASINRTPAVKLLGISPSGFNATGESDIRNYYDYIRSKQELRRDAIMTCLKAIELVNFGHLDPEVDFEFKELSKEDESTSAMTAQARTAALTALAQVQAISAEEVRKAAKADPAMKLGFLTDEAPDMEPQDLDIMNFPGLETNAKGGATAAEKTQPASNPPDETKQLLQALGGLSG